MRLLKQPGSICSRFSTGKYKSVAPDIRRLAAYIYALIRTAAIGAKAANGAVEIFMYKKVLCFSITQDLHRCSTPIRTGTERTKNSSANHYTMEQTHCSS